MRFLASIPLLLAVLSGCATLSNGGPTAELTAVPLPRIEAGMHTAPIKRIAADTRGRWLVTASYDKTARVWELETGELLRVLRPPIGAGHEGKLYAVALAPDGGTVAVAGWTGYEWYRDVSIYLFDRATGEMTGRIPGLPNVIRHLAFSPDGSRLAAVLGGDNGIRLYRTSDWGEVGRDTDHGAGSYWVAFDRQGRLATSSEDGYVRLYDRALRLITKAQAPGGREPFGLAFSPDGSEIAVGSYDSTVVNLLSGADLGFLHAPDNEGVDNGNLATVAWSRDGRTLYAGGYYNWGYERPLRIWDNAGRGPPREWAIASNTIMDLVPLDGGRLLFGAQDPAWGLLDANGKRIFGRRPDIADFRTPSDEIRISDDGAVVEVDFDVLGKVGQRQDHILLLDTTRLRLSLDPGDPNTRLQRRLAELGVDPGPPDGNIGPRTRKALRVFQRERELPTSGEPDRASRTSLGLPELWGPRTEAPGLEISDWRDSANPKLNGRPLALTPFEISSAVDVAPDGERFLLGTHWYLRLYDRTGKLLWRRPAPANTWAVKLSGDGCWAVAAFGDGSLRWFDVVDQGRERLALFIDGGAIAGSDGGGDAAYTAGFPWVIWTPEGFFDAGGGGERLMGWHLNRGTDRAGELVDAGQIGELFRRPDLVARALDDDYLRLAAEAQREMGDLRQLLAGNLPPLMQALGATKVEQRSQEFAARFRIQARGGGVGRIEWKVNGTEVGRMDGRGWFGIGLPGQKEARRPFSLKPGRNVIEGRAFDQADQLASQPVRWVVEVRASERRPAVYGLAVGISQYQAENLNLKYADADARAFAAALERQEGGLFREVEINTLVNGQATLGDITRAFEAMAAKAGPEDVFVLFLAGHGLAVDGRFHFIPWELKYRNRRSLTEGSLDEARLRELLSRVRAEKSLIVLDACHAGAVMQGPKLAALFTRGGTLEEMAAIDRLMQATGRTVMASSSEREFALEGLGGHGVFTHTLLEGLAGRADIFGNHNERIETSELADYLDEEVPRITRKVWGYAQQPMWELHGQSFPIGLTR